MYLFVAIKLLTVGQKPLAHHFYTSYTPFGHFLEMINCNRSRSPIKNVLYHLCKIKTVKGIMSDK